MKRNLSIVLALMLFVFPSCSKNGNEEENPNRDEVTLAIKNNPETCMAGTAMTFSLKTDASVKSVIWIFGDGKVSSSTGTDKVTHTYLDAGTYTVSAAATLTSGPTKETKKTVSITTSSATMSTSNAYPGRMEDVTFTLNNIANVSSVTWDFSDGSALKTTSSASETVSHRFSKKATYTIKADIKFKDATSQTVSSTINIVGESLSYACSNFDASKMWIMAHRGNTNAGNDVNFPPNSMAGFKKCVDLGYVEFIETDVQITKDGEVILMHDNYLKRFTNYNQYFNDEGYITNFTLADIRKYYLKTTSGIVTKEKVPTLREVLMEFRDDDVWFNLDKCGNSDVNLETVYNVVKECGCLDKVQFYVGTNTDRATLLSKMPGAIIAPHVNNQTTLAAMIAIKPFYMIQTTTGYANASWIGTINQYGLSVTNLLDDYSTAFKGGDTSTMDTFVAAGVRMIQTDYPQEMYTYLKGKGKH